MGKISIPEPVTETQEPVVQDKKTTDIADTFPNDEKILELIKKHEGIEDDDLTDKAINLISYRRFLNIDKDDKEEISYLNKSISLIKERGIKRQKDIASIIGEVQYKIGRPNDMRRVYQYLRIENQIKGLVNKLKQI